MTQESLSVHTGAMQRLKAQPQADEGPAELGLNAGRRSMEGFSKATGDRYRDRSIFFKCRFPTQNMVVMLSKPVRLIADVLQQT